MISELIDLRVSCRGSECVCVCMYVCVCVGVCVGGGEVATYKALII